VFLGPIVSPDTVDAYAQASLEPVESASDRICPSLFVEDGLSAVFLRRADSRPSPYSFGKLRPSRSLVSLQSLAMCPSLPQR
jgi:hypothetical protein